MKKRTAIKNLLVLNLVFLIFGMALKASAASAGDLDASFGTAGRVTISVIDSSKGNGGFKAIVAPGGKIYQFGSTSDTANTSHAAIICLADNGTLDPSFAGGGRLATNYAELSFSRFYNGAIQPDGKILAVGAAIRKNLNYGLLARFLPDGELDTAFGGAGTGYVLSRNPDAIQIDFYWSNVAVLADGKIVVGGTLDYQMAAARFTAGGDVDTGFDTGGFRIIPVDLLGEAWDMKITREGKILLAGKTETSYTDGNYSDFVLLQLTADGALDPMFAAGGINRFDLTPNSASDAEILQSVQLLPDGKILVFGRIGDLTIDSVVCRFTPDGFFDTSFGANGAVVVDYNGQNNVPQDMAVEADGRIVLVGTDGNNNFLVQRLLPDGSMDASFGAGGSVVTDFGGHDRPYSVTLVRDKILVAGYALGTDGKIRTFALARYLQNASSPQLAPLKGRLVNLLGRGIGNARVTLTTTSISSSKKPLAVVMTDAAGFFQFPDVTLSQQYVLIPQASRCYFIEPRTSVNFVSPDATSLLKANCFRLIK